MIVVRFFLQLVTTVESSVVFQVLIFVQYNICKALHISLIALAVKKTKIQGTPIP